VTAHALEQQFEFVDTEGLGHIVVSPMLHGLHGRLHGAIAGDHDDDGLRTAVLDAAQGFQPAGAGKAQVEEDSVNGLDFEQAKRVLGGVGHEGVEAQRLGDVAAGLADGALIVNDEEVEKISGLNLRRAGNRTYSC
jgi:hypothetical protein